MIYFQYFFSSGLGFLCTVPNLLLPVVIYFSTTRSNITGLILGFILGVVLDLNAPSTFGISTLLFVLLGFFFGEIKSKLYPPTNAHTPMHWWWGNALVEGINREQKVFLLLLIFFANLFYFLFSNLLFVIFQEGQAILFMKIIFLTFYNSCYSAIIIFLIFLIDNLQISIKNAR